MPRAAGSGIKKGQKQGRTLDKIAAREVLRQMVVAELGPMTEAQIANAKGLSHLFMRDATGKFVQIIDPEQIAVILNSGERDKYFYIQTKDPSIQAYTDLMNRALDKPAEQVKVTGAEDGPIEVVFRWR